MPHTSTNRDHQRATISTPELTLAFSLEDGGLRELRHGDGPNLIGHGKPMPAIDIRLGDRGWLADQSFVRYLRHSFSQAAGAAELRITIGVGPLVVHDCYRITGTLITRTVELVNVGEDPVQLRGVRMLLPWARVGALESCRFDAPGNVVRPHVPLLTAAAQRRDLGARGWFAGGPHEIYALDRAPTQGSGALALHDPSADQALFCWFYSDADTALPQIEGNTQALTLTHEIEIAEVLPSEARVDVGAQFLLIMHEPWPAALGALERTWALRGRRALEQPAAWARNAAIYETHPAFAGGFLGLAAALPELRALGINTLCLMPIWDFANASGQIWDGNWEGTGSPYAIRDFASLDRTLGDASDLRVLIDTAHAYDMRVVADLPLEGCAADSPLVAEHPGWFCYDEDGQIQHVGWRSPLVAYDWSSAALHDFLVGWAADQLRALELDGFRLMLPRVGAPHWQRAQSLGRADRLGVRAVLQRLRPALLAINPEAALLGALAGPGYDSFSDAALDDAAHHMFMHLALGRITPHELGEWLEDHARVRPPELARICYTENHLTRLSNPIADGLRGSRISRMLLAGMVLCGFVPLIAAGQEQAEGALIERLLRARAESPALRDGAVVYNGLPSSNAQVFAVLRQAGGEPALGLLNVGPHKQTVAISLPVDRLGLPDGEYELLELLEQQLWAEGARCSWGRDELLALHLTLEPYSAYCLLVRAADRSAARALDQADAQPQATALGELAISVYAGDRP